MLLSLSAAVPLAYPVEVTAAKRRARPATLAEQVQTRVRMLRTARGMTQEELCERAGISIDAVTRIESRRRVPNLATVERLAAGLGVSPRDLLDPAAERKVGNPALAQRIATLVEAEPPEVQRAIEKIIRTVVAMSRSL